MYQIHGRCRIATEFIAGTNKADLFNLRQLNVVAFRRKVLNQSRQQDQAACKSVRPARGSAKRHDSVTEMLTE